MQEYSPNYLIDGFRNKDIILALAYKIKQVAKDLASPLRIMEVCGGHTHTIMKYGLHKLLPENIDFIHGPGCPVCIMPKNRINQAYDIAMQKDVILLTLGDMIKVPGSKGSLQDARANGAEVGFVYSPTQALKIAEENPHKKVVFFAIGFETTTPMSAALIKQARSKNLKNLYCHINHVLVPPPLHCILDSSDCKINALIAPSHVSVISGAKIYKDILDKYKLPIVVSGFEPVDMMDSILRIATMAVSQKPNLQIQYDRVATMQGNLKAQNLINEVFSIRDSFEWRGLGEIKDSALRLKDEFGDFDAEIEFSKILSYEKVEDNKSCKCGDILKGIAKPYDCKVFGKACTPQNPLGSCMVSSEGACAAYYKYKQ